MLLTRMVVFMAEIDLQTYLRIQNYLLNFCLSVPGEVFSNEYS